MVKSLIRKKMVYINILYTISVNIYIFISESQKAILPKFISASNKDNLNYILIQYK